MAHKYYEPTEYEEQLAAAGWIDLSDLDDVYAKYKQDTDNALDYESWMDLRREWDSLETVYLNITTSTVTETERKLVARMSEIELLLGY